MSEQLRPWLEERADRIERLCAERRLFVRVQGGVVTPRLVRFHLLLDPAVPLKRLERLSEDLALALGVASCRLSRRDGILSLEVPRPRPAVLSLVRLQAELPPLPPCTALLGRDEEGSPLLLRLSSPEVSHLLIAGTTGSGKTALLRALLSSLALSNDPLELRFLLVDPKGRGLGSFQGLPHLAAPVLREGEEAERRLSWLLEEMLWREEKGVREPRVVVAVDEVADLLLERPPLQEVLTRLAARGRESGLHLVLCTQKPTAEALGGLLRANLPCRVVGRVVNAQEAVVASGLRGTGAERLLGRGDFILVAGGEVVRFQAAYISREEVEVMVEMLREEVEEREQGIGIRGQGAGGRGQGAGSRDQGTGNREQGRGKVIPFPGRLVERVVGILRR